MTTSKPNPNPDPDSKRTPSIFGKRYNVRNLYFYQKSDVIYQLSFVFCDRYIHLYKDRTRDQIIQAARSCKQNIVEGLSDGLTSTELQVKLLNVVRSSLEELREDFVDYIKSRHLCFYQKGEERYERMLQFCRVHNDLFDYKPFFNRWDDEVMCNYGITLCHMVDRMMMRFLGHLEKDFIEYGGIKERMTSARTGYRKGADARLRQLEDEYPRLIRKIEEVKAENQQLQAKYEDLKQRALKAFYAQQDEIKRLKGLLGEKLED